MRTRETAVTDGESEYTKETVGEGGGQGSIPATPALDATPPPRRSTETSTSKQRRVGQRCGHAVVSAGAETPRTLSVAPLPIHHTALHAL